MTAKLWLLAAVAAGAVIGGTIGFLFGHSVVASACQRPDASNLCGLTSAPMVPFLIAIGAVIGASVGALATAVIVGKNRT